ncbi:sulfotransferase [Pseudoalteromonas sp. ZZD1]|uniref:sulfotransferase n=1 Tax=Pseudoalteromonas sp. ZZD1 TaxID=3139395 RepID=UPI003BAD453B
MNKINEPHFLFFSLGRCGTTLFQSIVNSHPSLHLSDEVHWFPHMKSAGLQYHRFFEVDDISAQHLPALSLWWQAIKASHSILFDDVKSKKWGLQFIGTRNIPYIKDLIALYPKARVILLLRDPRDLHLSLLSTGIGHYNSGKDLLNITKVVEESGNPYTTIQYEQLCSIPEQTLRKLSNFLNVSYFQSMLIPLSKRISHAQDTAMSEEQGVHKKNTSVLSKWKTKIPSIDLALQNYQFNYVKELGYEVYEDTAYLRLPTSIAEIHFICCGAEIEKKSTTHTLRLKSLGCICLIFDKSIQGLSKNEATLEYKGKEIKGKVFENIITFDLRVESNDLRVNKVEHSNNKGAHSFLDLIPFKKDKSYYLYSAGSETLHCLNDYYLKETLPLKGVIDLSPTKKNDSRFELPILSPHLLTPDSDIVLITTTYHYFFARKMLEELGFTYDKNIFYIP